MGYRSLGNAVIDLEKSGQLVRVTEEIDPKLEMAEIHRRVYDHQGPAILFEHVKGSPFKAVSNIYGTNARAEFLFRHTLERVAKVIALRADFSQLLRRPFRYMGAPWTAFKALPWKTTLSTPVTFGQTKVSALPQVVCWPDDGGAFITLPQVFTQAPGSANIMHSNLGMYRIQLSGNDYEQDKEVGMHYQLQRGIGVHHKAFLDSEEPFRASIFIGGPPSHALSAIFPLPEDLSELTFAGMLANRRFRYHYHEGYAISNDADFVLTGVISKTTKKPEGPFGDHLGYYSLQHDFPVFTIDKVYHRKDPLWHFTVVGRPPQEDSGFGHLIHLLVGPLLAGEFPGVMEVNAVDVAGVHPLLLAIGSERYMPFRDPRPEEILTQANHLLGSGQTSLAKYLIIAAGLDQAPPSTKNERAFIRYILERIDWRRDLHFQTRTTIDTLDYSGSGWNEGSKVVIACYSIALRTLISELAADIRLTAAFGEANIVDPGILAIKGPAFEDYAHAKKQMEHLAEVLKPQPLEGLALIVIVDDPRFCSEHFDNFLWVTFTRSNPSHDIYGVGAFTVHKHWGCSGPLIIDARIKPHHAPPLVADKKVADRVDQIFSKNGSLGRLKI